MPTKVNFIDGASSSTTPVIGNLATTEFVQYADDASFEAANVGSPIEGNAYFNTTTKLIRYYNGTEWIDILDQKTAQVVENKTIDGTDASGNNTVKADADDITHDPSGNSFTATEMQGLADEAAGRLDTNEANISQNQTDIDDLETLSGSPGATDHGSFTGTTIPDNSTTKQALQSLETEVENKIDSSEKGSPNGVATLDGSGLVPAAQLPSYVDDVVEYANFASFPGTGETGKIYVALDTNKTYRWTGATYIEVSASDVTSVQGQTGTVSLDTDDIPEGVSNKYYDDALVSANSDVVANTAKVSADGSIDTHSDVDTTTTPPALGDILRFDGTNWVPDIESGGGGSAALNYLMNGNLDNWRRGNNRTFSSNGYIMERWFAGATGPVTYQELTSSPPVGSTSYARITWPNAGNNHNDFYYLEDFDVNPLKGKTVTLSMLVRKSGTLNDGWSFRVFKNATPNTRTGGSWTQIASQSFLDADIPTSTGSSSDWEEVKLTFTVPDDGSANGLRLNMVNLINPNAGAYIEIAQMMLFIGSTRPSSFVYYGGSAIADLSACERYYNPFPLYLSARLYGGGAGNSWDARMKFPTTMRIAPSLTNISGVTVSSGSAPGSNQVAVLSDSPAGYVTGTGSITGGNSDIHNGSMAITYTGMGGATAGNTGLFIGSGDMLIGFDAEFS